mmetsp:Transcript_37922/g.99324  ORF Transcript_37922/g.99324 Transcript_37922/m.99324 type:complete len:94 (-) Transcript_37922:180-461(-)
MWQSGDLLATVALGSGSDVSDVGQDLDFKGQWPAFRTPWDGNGSLVQCMAAPDCVEGMVVRCSYREDHGFWPLYAEEMTWWWFKSLGHGTFVV